MLPYKNVSEFLGFTAGVLIVNLAVANLAPESIKAMFRV